MLCPTSRSSGCAGYAAVGNAPGGYMDETAIAAETITIVYTDTEPGAKGLSPRDVVTKIGSLDSAILSANLTAFCKRISGALTSAADVADGFKVDSFEITADI